MFPPLELCFYIRKCEGCGELTNFFVTEEMESWTCLAYVDENGKPRVVSELIYASIQDEEHG